MVSFLILVLTLLLYAVKIYLGVIAVYCLLTWLPGCMQSGLGRFLARLTEPFLGIFDRVLPSIAGIGFSPIVAGFVLYLVERGLVTIMNLIIMGA